MGRAKNDLDVSANLGRNLGSKAANERAGRINFTHKLSRQAKLFKYVSVKLKSIRIYKRRRRCICKFLFLDPGKLIHKILGYHKEISDPLEPARYLIRIKLINRVKRVKLYTRARIKLRERDNIVNELYRLVYPCITVGKGRLDLLVTPHKNVVNAPGVDRKALDFAKPFYTLGNSRLDLAKEPVGIPNEVSVLGIHSVRKAIDLLGHKLPILHIADYMASA